MTHTRIILTLGLFVLLAAGVARAALSPQKLALKCRAAIAKIGAATIRTRLKQLDACHTARDKRGAATDCNVVDAASLQGKIAAVIAKKCRTAGAVLANYGSDPGAEIAAGVAAAIAASGRTLQGSPDLGGDKQKVKCHGAIGKGRSGVVAGVVGMATRCQAALDRSAGEFGGLQGECLLSAEVNNARARSAIQRACGTVAGADVGSCPTLPECVIAAATTTGQQVAAALYGGDRPAQCGDGISQSPEECDDGNGDDGDGCTTSCRLPVCGDGFVQAGVEQCDDRNEFEIDTCVRCQAARCGDGAVQDGVEECDDGNETAGDGCSACRKDPIACGPNGVAVTVAVAFEPSAVPGLRGVQLTLDYPVPAASLPGSTPVDLIDLVENTFDPDGSRGSLLVANDRDTNSDGTDDRLSLLYTATENLPADPNHLVRVLFSCQSGATFVPADFGCTVTEAVDEIGSAIRGIACVATDVVSR